VKVLRMEQNRKDQSRKFGLQGTKISRLLKERMIRKKEEGVERYQREGMGKSPAFETSPWKRFPL